MDGEFVYYCENEGQRDFALEFAASQELPLKIHISSAEESRSDKQNRLSFKWYKEI